MLCSYRRFGQLINPILEGRAALLYPLRWGRRCPETSVANSHCKLYKIPEEQTSPLHRAGSLTSRGRLYVRFKATARGVWRRLYFQETEKNHEKSQVGMSQAALRHTGRPRDGWLHMGSAIECNWVLFRKLTVVHLAKKYAAFYRTRGSLPYSQQPAPAPYSEPDEPSLHFDILLPSGHFNTLRTGGVI